MKNEMNQGIKHTADQTGITNGYTDCINGYRISIYVA